LSGIKWHNQLVDILAVELMRLLISNILALTLLVIFLGAEAHEVHAARLDDRAFNDLRTLAHTVADQGGPERAIPLLMRHPDDPRVLGLLLEYYSTADRSKEFAALAAKQAAAQPSDRDIQLVYLQALHRAGQADSIMPLASRIIAAAPDSSRATWKAVGIHLGSFGMWGAALDVFSRGRAAVGDNAAFGSEIALARTELGWIGEAVDELLMIIKANPKAGGQHKQVAYRISAKGEKATEILLARLEKSLKRAEGEAAVGIQSLLMDLELTDGLEKKAYEHLSSLLRKLDSKRSLRMMQIFIGRATKLSLLESSLAGYALADTLKLIGHEMVLMGRAEILLRLERFENAEHHYVELTGSGNPQIKAMAWRKLGDLYLNRLNRPGQALACYRGLEQTGGLAKEQLLAAKLSIAESFIRLSQLDKAGALCREIVASPDTQPVETSGALLLLGDVFFFGGQPDSAAENYFNFARLNLGDERANEAMGKLYLIRQDRSPDSEAARQVGKALFAASTGDIQQARDLFAGILRQQVDSLYRAQVFYQMGRMYEREGEYTLALGTFGQLAEQFPEHQLAPLAELRMGTILLEEIGDLARARVHFERVVMEYPQGVATAQARRLLRNMSDEKL
jgi:tetratricopeptide (TPR) repeat protein